MGPLSRCWLSKGYGKRSHAYNFIGIAHAATKAAAAATLAAIGTRTRAREERAKFSNLHFRLQPQYARRGSSGVAVASSAWPPPHSNEGGVIRLAARMEVSEFRCGREWRDVCKVACVIAIRSRMNRQRLALLNS